jgi:hypothetical protein
MAVLRSVRIGEMAVAPGLGPEQLADRAKAEHGIDTRRQLRRMARHDVEELVREQRGVAHARHRLCRQPGRREDHGVGAGVRKLHAVAALGLDEPHRRRQRQAERPPVRLDGRRRRAATARPAAPTRAGPGSP